MIEILNGGNYSSFIYKTRYARFDQSKEAREKWIETVARYVNFLKSHTKNSFSRITYDRAFDSIYNLNTMPSMRAILTAGKALEIENLSAYNCGYLPIIDLKCFSELLYIAMNGTGIGSSVERHNISKLPKCPSKLLKHNKKIVVEDSKLGWAEAFNEYLEWLFDGAVRELDVSKIRPAGTPLLTFGGRASGPDALLRTVESTTNIVNNALSRQLKSTEVFDIICSIAKGVVVGGVRRIALIILFDLFDREMLTAKSGEWWLKNQDRALANISAVFDEKTKINDEFLGFWNSLKNSGSGEPGMFNRHAARLKRKAAYRKLGLEHDDSTEYGTNPCGEIILRPFGLCNLTESMNRKEDSKQSMIEKVEMSSFLGTLQAQLTKFNFIRDDWRENCVEESLLGVSITGILDNVKIFEDIDYLKELNRVATEKNHATVDALVHTGFHATPSAAITCIKPSGTVSQLCDTASGIHPRHSKFYFRRVRISKLDPVYEMIKKRYKKIHIEDDVTDVDNTAVIKFAIKSPNTALTRDDLSALSHLKLCEKFNIYYCDHNTSATVSVKDSEWEEVGEYLKKNMSNFVGVTFLPFSDHFYKQAPYELITKEQYKDFKNKHDVIIDWELLKEYEKFDQTNINSEFACVSGSCEL